MTIKLCALALAGALLSPLASAQSVVTPICLPPKTGVQTVFNNLFDTQKPRATVATAATALKNVEGLVKLCATEPYTLKAAAVVYASVPAADARGSVTYLARSRELFRQMWPVLKGDTPPFQLANAQGQSFIFGFDDLYQTESQVRQLLFKAEEVAGELAPEDMPVGKGAPMRACGQTDYSDSQQAYFYLKDKDHPGAFNLLDREAQYCSAEIDKGQYVDILGHRARSLLASAKRAGTDKPDALDKLKRARADADRFLKIRKGVYSAGMFWSSDDNEITNLLLQAMMKQNATPPKEAWFKPPLVSDPITAKYIGFTLDAAWAKDAPSGVSTAYKIYRDTLTGLFTLAASAPDPKAAKKLLYSAAKDHAEGRIRAPENIGLKQPPSFLYNWIDPDYVAPKPSPTP